MLGGLYFRMILLINICREKLHYLEFVKPVEDILKKAGKSFFVKKYKEVTKEDLARAEKIIICGTSLRDNDFALPENTRFFSWIRDFDKPLLGICGGMQVIAKLFGARIKKEPEIGFFKEKFHKAFLGVEGSQEVYHLHNYYVDLYNSDELEYYSISDKEIVEAFKHRTKQIYGTLFHPEVRQKVLIENFVKL
jgi:GMP synthase (glutamine-hydrolysing)